MDEQTTKMRPGSDAVEPIAVVGMAMRFPGGAHSSEQFWDMLKQGRSAHSQIPKERYDATGYYHPDNARAGAINVKGAYFLSESATLFDAPFFSMTANEAQGTDPQQRLMLEVAYEALENAGISMRNIVGTDTSVYVGCFTRDWEAVSGRDPYGGPFYAATGNGQSMLSNRVSWFFDLRGPSMTIDTACSSSLYAIHLACQSLKLGESKMALVGGTNLIADCSYIRDAVTMGFFSPDGICHSFDHRANGYARGDGIGGVVLKTLTQALADGDTIRAVIRNTGINQDGKTPGITMPSPQMQAELIRSTYAAAGLSLDKTAYFEAHGTGTSIGDPYELSALGATFGQTRTMDNPIYVGSVKTNIGHLEGCAGIAGVIKSILLMEQGTIAPLAGFEKANPKLRLEEWRVALAEKLTPWPTTGLRRVSVNSFGYGGSNAHIILDDAYNYLKERRLEGNHQTLLLASDVEAPDSGFNSEASTSDEECSDNSSDSGAARLFVISSSDQAGLQRLQNSYASFLDDKLAGDKEDQKGGTTDWKAFMSDLAFTLGSRRSLLDHRSFVVARSASDLSRQLQNPVPKLRRIAKNNNIIMIFTGQGAQWPTMGAQLISYKVYRDSLERAQITLDSIGCTWSLIEELHAPKGNSRIDSPEFSQPLCTALQLGLVDLLSTWGVHPKSVVGHSSGEIGAAYAARYITHQDAIKIAYWRGVYSADIKRRQPDVRGAMMAVGLSEAAAKMYLAKVEPDSVVVGCINAPSSVTLSGDEVVIDQLESMLKADGIFARKLRVQTAYHSPHVRVVAEDYLRSLGALEPPVATDTSPVTMFSSVVEAPVSAKDLGPAYWVKNMLNPVRFAGAVKALVTQPAEAKGRRKAVVPYSAMIECGPAEALKGPLTQILQSVDERLVASVPYSAMLSRGVDAETTALTAAGRLWAQGLNVDLTKINARSKRMASSKVLSDLPPYPWNHTKGYLHESGWGKKYRYKNKPRTDLLGMQLENQDPTEPRWHNYVRLSEQPWLADHRVQQMTLYPGAAMVVMAFEAARELVDVQRVLKAIQANDVKFKRGLVIPSRESAVETAIHLRPIPERTSDYRVSYGFKVLSQEEGQQWQENCTGSVEILYDGTGTDAEMTDSQHWAIDETLYADIKERATKIIAPKTYYKLFDRKMNLQYGPLHQGVTKCVAGIGEGYGEVTIPDTRSVMPCQFEYPHLIHPSTLDAVFHMQALGYLHSLSGEESLVPVSIGSIYVSADVSTEPGSKLKGYSKGTQSESGDSVGDIVLSDERWKAPKVVVRGFFAQDLSVTSAQPASADSRPRKCTTMEWVELDDEAVATPDIEADENMTLIVPAIPEEINLPEVLILHQDDASEAVKFLAQNLSIQLSGPKCHAKPVVFADLMQADAVDVNDKCIISLLEAETPYIRQWRQQDFDQFKSLVLQAGSILWITRGGASVVEKDLNFSLTTGLLRTVRVERLQMKLPHLDLSAGLAIDGDVSVQLITRAFKSTVLNDDEAIEQEFVEQGGKLFVPRMTSSDSFHAELGRELVSPGSTLQVLGSVKQPLTAVFSEDGKSLQWAQHKGKVAPINPTEVQIKVQAASLETIDSMGGSTFSGDVVGHVTEIGSEVKDFELGELVVTCASEPLKTIVRSSQSLVRKMPKNFTVPQASLLPSAVCTARLALVDSAHIQRNETVLISAAPGPIGHALIALSMHIGAEVYVISSSAAHLAYLKTSFELDDEHILSTATSDTKFDVIVNALYQGSSEELVSSLADFGRFISVESATTITSPSIRIENGTFATVKLGHLRKTPTKRFSLLLSQAWQDVEIPMLSNFEPRAFACTNFEGAGSSLLSANGTLGTVMTFSDEDVIAVLPNKSVKLKLDPAATYVLSGGLGGIGRSIADMMFAAGARNISFISRSGAQSAEAKQLLGSLQARGCNAQAYRCDIADSTAVELFVKACEQRGESIKGLIQCAMVLRDSMFENMTFDQWEQCTAPKVIGTFNLHRFMPRNIDFFIMLSSMAGVIGSPGQANYSAAGTYQDALSVHRRAQGLASTTIDLGIASDVGYLAENPEALARFDYLEPLFISERDLHAILSAVMLGHTRDGNPVPSQVVTGIGKELMQDGSIGAAMSADRKYAHLADSTGDGASGDGSEEEEIKFSLKAAETLREASNIVESVLTTQVSRALTMEKDDVDLEKPMHAYGVDSLVAVEVRNMLFRKLKADISVFDILSSMPLSKLAMKVLSKSKFARSEVNSLALAEVTE